MTNVAAENTRMIAISLFSYEFVPHSKLTFNQEELIVDIKN